MGSTDQRPGRKKDLWSGCFFLVPTLYWWCFITKWVNRTLPTQLNLSFMCDVWWGGLPSIWHCSTRFIARAMDIRFVDRAIARCYVIGYPPVLALNMSKQINVYIIWYIPWMCKARQLINIDRAMVISCNVLLELRHTIPTVLRPRMCCKSKKCAVILLCKWWPRGNTGKHNLAMPCCASYVLEYVEYNAVYSFWPWLTGQSLTKGQHRPKAGKKKKTCKAGLFFCFPLSIGDAVEIKKLFEYFNVFRRCISVLTFVYLFSLSFLSQTEPLMYK